MPVPARPLLETFTRHTAFAGEDECWLWTGPRHGRGYGLMSGAHEGLRTVRAHRFSYRHYKGPIPNGLEVRHTCDTPACVNPRHLLAGTHKENMHDCIQRGRFTLDGTHNVRKLTSEQIAEVRLLARAGQYQRDIAKRFGVSQRTVTKIINGIDGYAKL